MIEIRDKAQCCGCTACASICPQKCIEMKDDREGFAYPVINQSFCVNCGACVKVCPILNSGAETEFKQEGYIVQNKNNKVLFESTAGGAFTAIAKYVLNKGGVVFGVGMSEKLVAHHFYIENEQELFRFRNSKYVQSIVGDGFQQVKQFLKQGRYVCFSGTPCQIEGLKLFLGKDYPNLLTVDVVCRAVPSPLIFRKYLEYQEKKLETHVKSVRFRDKYYGYKYSTLNLITATNQGKYHKGVESDPWLRAFFSNICDRPSCHKCRFRKRWRVSDFTIWDCFHVGRYSKEMDNDKGATRVLVHSEKAKQVFEFIKDDLNHLKINPESIIKDSVELKGSVVPHQKRAEFFDDANKMDGYDLFVKWFPETLRVKSERTIRMLCYKLGIYSLMKKIYVRVTHKY